MLVVGYDSWDAGTMLVNVVTLVREKVFLL